MTRQQSIERMFNDVDAMNAERFAGFLAEGVRFQFGSAPEVVGRAAVQRAVADFFASIKGLKHEITALWTQQDVSICRLSVKYTRKNGSTVVLPSVTIFGFNGELIEDYRIYMDVNPVFAQQ